MVCCHNSDMPTIAPSRIQLGSNFQHCWDVIFSDFLRLNHLCKNQRKCLDGTIKPLSGTNAISWYQKLPQETCFFAVRFWDSDFTSKYTREGWKRVSMLQYFESTTYLGYLKFCAIVCKSSYRVYAIFSHDFCWRLWNPIFRLDYRLLWCCWSNFISIALMVHCTNIFQNPLNYIEYI